MAHAMNFGRLASGENVVLGDGALVILSDVLLYCAICSLVSLVVAATFAKGRKFDRYARLCFAAWGKAFASFAFVYAIHMLDTLNGDVGPADFVVVTGAGILLLRVEFGELEKSTSAPAWP